MCYLRAACSIWEIIIAGIIRWNVVTKSPQISCNELSEREKVVFGNLRLFAVGCQIVFLQITVTERSQKCSLVDSKKCKWKFIHGVMIALDGF